MKLLPHPDRYPAALPVMLSLLLAACLCLLPQAQAQDAGGDPDGTQDRTMDGGRAALLDRADELAARGSWQAAIELYGLVDDPRHARRRAAGLAAARQAIGEYAGAENSLLSVIDGDVADWPQLATQLAELLRDTGRSAEALEILEAVISGNPVPPVRSVVRYGELLQFRGRREEAVSQFTEALRRYNAGTVFESADVAMVALSNWHLGRFHEANALFDEALRIDEDNVEARVLWGRLFQEKYNEADAERAYNEALAVNRRYVPALVGLAAIGDSERYLSQALEINPRDTAALETFGSLLIRDEQHEEGRRFLDEALEINPESVTALGMLAGLAALNVDMARFGELETRVQGFSPDNADFYITVAELMGHNYRFAEAVSHARQAIEADPASWEAHTVLGNNLVRLGEEAEGRRHLELAFDNDPFNVLTSNLLQLYDTLDDYATLETEHFRVNMSTRDALVLWPYMSALLEESWEVLVERYRFEPEVPVIIQVFENTEDFAVRSVGLPDIGPLVGICFGKVVTLISPDELRANWQEIVWHELVHVFTLQMTGNRMPRWLSEGISTWEESQLRPEWGRRQGLELVRAVQEDRLLPVGDLNDGFRSARSNADLGFAYFQSYLVVDYIVEQHGFEQLLALIGEYGEIREDSERFRNVFAMDLDAFDAGFQRWIRQRVEDMNVHVHADDAPDQGSGHGHGVRENNSAILAEVYNNASIKQYMRGRIQSNPRDFQAHLQLGIVLFREGDHQQALEHLREAHAILPDYAGYPSPPLIMSQIHQALGDSEARLAQLEILLGNQQHDFDSAMVLAEDALQRGDLDRADYYTGRALAVDPYQIGVHELAAELARRRAETGRAVQEYEIIAELDDTDPVNARTELARAYLDNGQAEAARRSILRALELAPTYESAQSVLLDTVEALE